MSSPLPAGMRKRWRCEYQYRAYAVIPVSGYALFLQMMAL